MCTAQNEKLSIIFQLYLEACGCEHVAQNEELLSSSQLY
jgi:hypothetical protein